MRPLYDRVVVRRLKEEEKVGSLFIPEVGKEKPAQGIVLAVGLGQKTKTGDRIALDVQVGDKVLFGKYAGNEVEIELEKLVILNENEIMAVLES